MGEPLDVILETLTAVLGTTLEVPGSPSAFIGALEVFDECLPEVGLVVDGVNWQMLERGPRPIRKVDGEELGDEVVVLDSHHAASKAVILKPDARI